MPMTIMRNKFKFSQLDREAAEYGQNQLTVQ